MPDFHQLFELLGQLSTAVIALLAAARPVLAALRGLAKITRWSWDDAFLKHLDSVHEAVDKFTRAITSAKK